MKRGQMMVGIMKMGMVKIEAMMVKMRVVKMEMVKIKVVRKGMVKVVMVMVGVTVSVLSEMDMVRNMTAMVLVVDEMKKGLKNRELCCLELLQKSLMFQ
jgi:hypothetical protein